jgi:hypothetical protein
VAENASLAARLSAADIQVRRMVASVQLVKALGGGWSAGGPQAAERFQPNAAAAATGSSSSASSNASR